MMRVTEKIKIGNRIGFDSLTARKVELDNKEVRVLVEDGTGRNFNYLMPDDMSTLKTGLFSFGISASAADLQDMTKKIEGMYKTYKFPEEEKKEAYNLDTLKDFLNCDKSAKWKRSLMVLHSLSAPLNCIYNKNTGDVYNPVLLIVGESSTGKTSAARYVQSLSTDVNDSTYCTSMIGSRITLVQRMTDIMGMPVLLDDTSNRKNTDFEELIYNLCAGKENERTGQKRGIYGIKGGRGFQVNVTITGEDNPFAGKKSKGGITGRMFILKVHQGDLTDSPKQSRLLEHQSVLRGNIRLRDKIVDLINERGEGEIYSIMESKTEWYSDRAVKDGIVDRWSRYYSVLDMTAELFSSLTGIKIDVSEIVAEMDAVLLRKSGSYRALSKSALMNDFYNAVRDEHDRVRSEQTKYAISAARFDKIRKDLEVDFGSLKPMEFKERLFEEGILESPKSKVVNTKGVSGKSDATRYYFVMRRSDDLGESIKINDDTPVEVTDNNTEETSVVEETN